MRLLCIFPWLSLGGADKFNLDLLGCLKQRGWIITVVTTLPSGHAWRAAFAPLCDEIVDLTAFAPHEWPARLLMLAQPSDVVFVSHSLFGYHILPYLRAQLPATAFVDYCHMREPRWLDGGFPRISVNYAAYLDRQLVSSKQLKSWMIDQGATSNQMMVCTTNIDADDWDASRYDRFALRHALGIDQHVPVILYAGRLTRQKQPRMAAQVMRRIATQRPDALFLVAGDGEYRSWLERFVRRQRLHRQIRLLGAVDNAHMRELLALSDMFFLPSENEGISLAVYEALAMGVVPVTADVGGQRELVTPECGLLVQRSLHEADDYSAALLRLLADTERIKRMGAAGRERVRTHFSLEAMGECMHTQLLAAHQRRQRDQRTPSRAVALQSAQRAIAQASDDMLTADRRWRTRLRPRRLWSALRRRFSL